MMTKVAIARSGLVPFVAALFVVAALSIAAGIWFYQSQVTHMRQHEHDVLASVAVTKADWIVAWRERLAADARLSGRSPYFMEHVAGLIDGKLAASEQDGLRARMALLKHEGLYREAAIADSSGNTLLSSLDAPGVLPAATRRAIARARSSGAVEFTDPYQATEGLVVIDVVAPIRSAGGTTEAFVVLRQDTATELDPQLLQWPLPSQTAETLLAMRDGDEVVFLGKTRLDPASRGVSRHIPITRQDVPTVQALFGKRGVFEGTDYRGQAVLADLRAVQGSPWILVSKIDSREAFASVRERSLLILGVAVLLLLLVIAAMALAYRHRQAGMTMRALAAEREKLIALESLRTTLYSIGDGVITTDENGAVQVMNKIAEFLTGWKEADALGKPIDEVFRIINEESRATVESPVRHVLREGVIVGLANHTLLVARDGTERPVADSGAPVHDAQGRIQGTVLVFRDQTEEHAANAKLLASEESFRNLAEHANDGILITVSDTRHAFANGRAAEITGRDVTELLTTPVAVLAHPDERDMLVARARQRLAGDPVPEHYESALLHKAGHRVDVEISASRTSWHGEPANLIVIRDITERKRAEAERDALRVNLAQADRLSSVGMLAAGVAHEINNPLAYVLSNLESLAEDMPRLGALMQGPRPEGSQPDLSPGDGSRIITPALFEDALERLHEAQSGAQRIKGIARSLGSFSRVERAEVTPVNIEVCIENALTMAHNELKYRARLTRDYSHVPPVLASDGKLVQVFLNLVINAAHAIDEGNAERNQVRVRTWSAEGNVFVEISDTGKGIPEENQARVFEPFFTTKGPGVGSGLGLSICKSIVTGFGGDISLTSKLGEGTSFLVRLPRMTQEWEQTDARAMNSKGQRARARGRILVVDDEPGIRAAIVRALRGDHEIVTAASGSEARSLLENDRDFDLILSDLMMPAMSGMALHAWLTEQDAELARQVVFVTGGAFTPGASEYLARVDNLRIEKPFDSVGLRAMTSDLVIAAKEKRKTCTG